MRKSTIYKNCVYVLLCALAVFTSTAQSGIVSVENIAFNLPVVVWYQNPNFTINATGAGTIQMWGGTAYSYSINNANVTITPCALQHDGTTGGQVIGDFNGGATMTVSGDLYKSGTLLATGQLLVGEMDVSASETWQLAETSSSSNQISNGSTDFTLTGGLLQGGIADGSDTLRIGDMALKLQFNGQTMTNFASTPMAMATSPIFQIAAVEVPEPMTLVLLGLGSLLLRRKN